MVGVSVHQLPLPVAEYSGDGGGAEELPGGRLAEGAVNVGAGNRSQQSYDGRTASSVECYGPEASARAHALLDGQ